MSFHRPPSSQPGLGDPALVLAALQALWVLETLHQPGARPALICLGNETGWGLPRTVHRWQSLVILGLGVARAAKQLGFSNWLLCPLTGFTTRLDAAQTNPSKMISQEPLRVRLRYN